MTELREDKNELGDFLVFEGELTSQQAQDQSLPKTAQPAS